MPPNRPAATGYERLAQADAFSDDSDEEAVTRSWASLQPASAPLSATNATQPRLASAMGSPLAANIAPHGLHSSWSRPPPRRRLASGAGVDLKAINARLERWADEIASRFKRRRRDRPEGDEDDDRLEIHYSVFQAPEGIRPATVETLAAWPPPAMAKAEFDALMERVQIAIEQGVHPRLISQGSSGSYFARDCDGKVVGVFKPKDEEPYAAGNPKWNKWIHRNLFPCFFGRAWNTLFDFALTVINQSSPAFLTNNTSSSLIPNLSYVSEAAAYVLDCQLHTNIVPYTEVVSLSSKSFHYPFWDRMSTSRNKKPLPAKPGSFQVFLKGFKDANAFLRKHPWPEQYWSGFRADPRRRRRRRWTNKCRPGSVADLDDSDSDADASPRESQLGPDNFVWTERLKQSFREELEKLVILDYIMRNTDRGLDNWMIKVDWHTQKVSVLSEPVQVNLENKQEASRGPGAVDLTGPSAVRTSSPAPYKVQRPMEASGSQDDEIANEPTITIGAIDNSLSWPWKHPDAWRSFPFGWLFLPVGLIGQPFSAKTRDHFLPLLTSTQWWSQTQTALRKVFMKDPDFQERMFARQIAVMKGQAWNVVETLKTADHGPLELARRSKVCVWDDLVGVPVAVPMRRSSEFRRRHGSDINQAIGEVDIGAASPPSNSTATAPGPSDHLLGSTSPPAYMPHSGSFGDRSLSPEAISPLHESTLLSNSVDAILPHRISLTRSLSGQHDISIRPHNLYVPARHRPGQPRRNSIAALRSKRSSTHQLYGQSSMFNLMTGDGFDGDLGYAVAEDMEGNQRKVIVERLEPVKTRNPVFTWC